MMDPYADIHCPTCGSEVWNNRERKASGQYKSTYPDFRCKACDAAGWLNPDGSWHWKASTRQTRHTPSYHPHRG